MEQKKKFIIRTFSFISIAATVHPARQTDQFEDGINNLLKESYVLHSFAVDDRVITAVFVLDPRRARE